MQMSYLQKTKRGAKAPIQTDEEILRQWDAYRVSGSPLHREVEAIAQKFGISRPVEVFVSRSKEINGKMHENASNELRIILTEPIIHALGGSPHGAVSDELKFVLGHELGHIAEGNHIPYLVGGLLPILTLPIIAVAAHHYLARAHQKQLPPEEAVHYIRREADKEQDPLQGLRPNDEKIHKEPVVIRTAKDVAVGALGFGAGSLVARENSNQLEFRCDKWGSRASSPQAGINMFEKIRSALKERKLARINVPESDPFRYGEAQSKVSKLLIDYLQATVASHPDTASRVAKLEKIAISSAARML